MTLTLVFAFWGGPTFSQGGDASDELGPDVVFATGGIPVSPEESAGFPATPLTRAFLPEQVDLSARFPRVGDQGQLGSCTAWAVGYAARSYYGAVNSNTAPTPDAIASPAYIYSALRPDCDGGTSIYAAMLLLGEGAISLKDMPYSDRSCPVITESMRQNVRNAGNFRVSNIRWVKADRVVSPFAASGENIRNLPDLFKAELAGGNPVVIGIQTDRAFHRLRGNRVWSRAEPVDYSGEGWHAVTIVGYDERGQYFKFINSWGTGWGERGFGRMSYQTVIDQGQPGMAMSVTGVDPSPPDLRPAPPPEPAPAPVPAVELPAVSCGRLRVETVAGSARIAGFVGTAGDMDKAAAAAAAAGLDLKVDLRPWPQCETLMTLEQPLAETDKPRIDLPQSEYAEGDTLAFSVAMAGFEGFLHIAYIQADGHVVNLVQQSTTNLRTEQRGSVHAFGDGKDGRAHFEVTGPFGNEMIVAIASASPLFSAPRPTVELEREFLTALRAAILARPDPNLPARRVTASFDLLTTREN